MADETTKPCIVCEKALKPEFEDWKHMQPSDGGEVKLTFSYGSKHDLCIFKGVICDECTDKIKNRLELVTENYLV